MFISQSEPPLSSDTNLHFSFWRSLGGQSTSPPSLAINLARLYRPGQQSSSLYLLSSLSYSFLFGCWTPTTANGLYAYIHHAVPWNLSRGFLGKKKKAGQPKATSSPQVALGTAAFFLQAARMCRAGELMLHSSVSLLALLPLQWPLFSLVHITVPTTASTTFLSLLAQTVLCSVSLSYLTPSFQAPSKPTLTRQGQADLILTNLISWDHF